MLVRSHRSRCAIAGFYPHPDPLPAREREEREPHPNPLPAREREEREPHPNPLPARERERSFHRNSCGYALSTNEAPATGVAAVAECIVFPIRPIMPTSASVVTRVIAIFFVVVCIRELTSWATSAVSSCGSAAVPDTHGRHRRQPSLPSSRGVSSRQRPQRLVLPGPEPGKRGQI